MVISKPIDMITVHDKEGKVKPFRMRITKDGNTNVYNLKVIYSETQRLDRNNTILKFGCTFKDENLLKKCEVHFKVQQTMWILYKIN